MFLMRRKIVCILSKEIVLLLQVVFCGACGADWNRSRHTCNRGRSTNKFSDDVGCGGIHHIARGIQPRIETSDFYRCSNNREWFCLRAIAGAVAIAAPVSIWLILCVFFLTLYLAFIKRQCDLSSASRMQGTQWKPRAKYGDLAELNWLLSVSGGLTVLMFLMYTLSAHAQGIFGGRSFGLALLTPIVLIVVHRFYRRAMQGLSDSPLDAIRSDPIVAVAMSIFVVGVYGILYVAGVEEFLRRALLI